MSDEQHSDVVCIKADGVSWRIFELEACQEHLGLTVNGRPEDFTASKVIPTGNNLMLWKLHTESTSRELWEHICREVDKLPDRIRHVNDPRNWLACHAKEKAFEIWRRENIPCPDSFTFQDERSFFKNSTFTYPMLVRLNNSTSGYWTHLCSNEVQAKEAIRNLLANFHYHHDTIPNEGVGRTMMAVRFIPTTRPEKVNMSFRIIVAGNRVVTGYARLGPADDWCAITNRFEPWMEEPFVKYQRLCQQFCYEWEPLIVRSVRCLGLNFQGVDVIFDQNDRPYFLEVQPGFSVGYAHLKSWLPPFYNPSKPDSLVKFLIANKNYLQDEIPLYYDYWLDKCAMFRRAFASLKEQLSV